MGSINKIKSRFHNSGRWILEMAPDPDGSHGGSLI